MSPGVALWLLRHRRQLWSLLVAGTMAILLPVTFMLLAVGATVQATQQQNDMQDAVFGLGCVTPAGPGSLGTMKLPGLPDSQQAEARANAQTIVQVAQSKNIPAAGMVVSLMTAMQESHLPNLPSGSADSVGLFQQRAACYPVSIGHDPALAAAAFFGAKGSQPGPAPEAGVLDVPNWQQLAAASPGRLAQTVQRSAFPTAYDKWQQTAT